MTRPLGHRASAKLVQVIRVEHQRGRGVEGDPLRTVVSWFEQDGTPIVEQDPESAPDVVVPVKFDARFPGI